MNSILLIAAALIPAVILGIYVFRKDRVDKEPLGLLLLLLLSGVVICFPVVEVGNFLQGVIDSVFSLFFVEYENGGFILGPVMSRVYNACTYFIAVAFVEEGFKWLAMFLLTRKSKHFNSLFDGLIYAVFVSLGFAAFENILYALTGGWGTVILRAATAVPGHVFDAVIMGYYYSFWHVYELARKQERDLHSNRVITVKNEFSGTRYLVLSIVMPVLSHGLYDYACTMDTAAATVLFYGFLIFLYIYCFRKIKNLSVMDTTDLAFASSLVLKKYPSLSCTLSESGVLYGPESVDRSGTSPYSAVLKTRNQTTVPELWKEMEEFLARNNPNDSEG